MPQLNASNGKCILAAQSTATTSLSPFTVQSYQFDYCVVTATSGYVKMSMRVGTNNVYTGEWSDIVVPFTSSATVTAGLLKTAIETALPILAQVDNSNGSIIVANNSTAGLTIQYKGLFGVTQQTQGYTFDLNTYEGDVYLLAKVSGGNIRYYERSQTDYNGDSLPTSSIGILVEDGGWFDVIGKENILSTQFIEETATAVIDYQIYIA